MKRNGDLGERGGSTHNENEPSMPFLGIVPVNRIGARVVSKRFPVALKFQEIRLLSR